MGTDAPFLLLLPAAGAYWLLTRSWRFRYRLRHERPGLVAYQVILFGTLFLGAGLVARYLFATLLPAAYTSWTGTLGDIFAPAVKQSNITFAVTCLYSLGFGLVAPLLLNTVSRWRGRTRDIYYLRANRDDAFEAQWYRAHHGGAFQLVQLTLDTNKVYIGTIAACPATEAGQRRSIQLLPLASGYRDPNTFRLILTTDYVEASNRIEENSDAAGQFEVVIRADRIVSSSPFDFVLYSNFQRARSAVPNARE